MVGVVRPILSYPVRPIEYYSIMLSPYCSFLLSIYLHLMIVIVNAVYLEMGQPRRRHHAHEGPDGLGAGRRAEQPGLQLQRGELRREGVEPELRSVPAQRLLQRLQQQSLGPEPAQHGVHCEGIRAEQQRQLLGCL